MSDHEKLALKAELTDGIKIEVKAGNMPLIRAVLAASGAVIAAVAGAVYWLTLTLAIIHSNNEDLKTLKPTVAKNSTDIEVIKSLVGIP